MINVTKVAVKLRKVSNDVTEATVSARELFLPKPRIASGILCQIKEEVGK